MEMDLKEIDWWHGRTIEELKKQQTKEEK